MVLPGQMASQVNVITKRENTVCTVGPPYLPLTSHHPGGLTHEFASKKKRGGGAQAIFSNQQHTKVDKRNFVSPCLLNSNTFPHQLFITVLSHPNYSKIDILNTKNISKASVNEMFNACYNSYVSFTSNL